MQFWITGTDNQSMYKDYIDVACLYLNCANTIHIFANSPNPHGRTVNLYLVFRLGNFFNFHFAYFYKVYAKSLRQLVLWRIRDSEIIIFISFFNFCSLEKVIDLYINLKKQRRGLEKMGVVQRSIKF